MGTSSKFIKEFFAERTSAPVCIVSYANLKEEAKLFPPAEIYTRDANEIDAFVGQYDMPGRAIYFGVNPVIEGKRRNKANIAEISTLHTDLDFKNIIEDRKTIEAVLARLPLKASLVVFSGNGLHGYWWTSATPDQAERIEAALKRLAWALAGDEKVAEIARVMRLPGSHNTKFGEWAAVKVVHKNGRALYELEQLEEWLASIDEPLLHRVVSEPASKSNGAGNIFQQMGAQQQPQRTDIDQLWDNLQYHGEGGGGNLHDTQVRIGASLLSRGEPVDDVISYLQAQITARVPESANWNWKEELRTIRQQCITWFAKDPKVLAKQLAIDGNLPEWLLRDRRIKALIEIVEPPDDEPAEPPSIKLKTPPPPVFAYITGEAMERLPLEPVEWIVDGFIMRDVVNGLFGDGGLGKDYLLLQLAIAMATDSKWLGRDVAPGRVLYFNVEDRVPRIRWRQNAILKYLQTSCAKYPDRLRVVPMVGQNTIIATYDSKSGLVAPTPVLTSVRNMIEDHKPDLAIMGNRVNIFGVNQNEDSQARQCIELLNAISMDYKTTLIMPGHVSLRGLSDESGSSGSGSSGTVQWSNALRQRLGLSKPKKDEDDDTSVRRMLTVLKSNDAPTDRNIELHWSPEHFLYVADDEDIKVTPASQMEPDDFKLDVEREFMRLLDKHTAKRENVSASATARNNAPLLFSIDPDCKREYKNDKGKRWFRAAMDRLFAKGSIKSVDTGSPSNPRPRIERTGLRVVKDDA